MTKAKRKKKREKGNFPKSNSTNFTKKDNILIEKGDDNEVVGMKEENLKTEQLTLDFSESLEKTKNEGAIKAPDSSNETTSREVTESATEVASEKKREKEKKKKEEKPVLSKFEKRKLKIKRQNDLLNMRGISKVFMIYLVEFIYIFLIEIIVKLILGTFAFDWTLLRIALSSLVLSFVITLFTTNLPLKLRRGLLIIVDFLAIFYGWLQLGFWNFMGTFMSLGNAEQGTKVTDYIFEFLKAYPLYYHLIWILFILVILYIVFEREITKDGFEKKVRFNVFIYDLAGLVYLALLVFMYYVTLEVGFMQNKYQPISNIELFKYPSNPSYAVRNFGTTMYFILDFKGTITGADREYGEIIDKDRDEEPETDYSRNIDDTAWENLIKIEENVTMNNLNKYFINREVTPKNDYTGLFEGKNLIMIMLESISEPLFHEEFKEYFPTFYKLYSEGITGINNYSPMNNCGTGESERTSQTSLYSIETACTVNAYRTNEYRQALLYMLRKNGYYTSTYHDFNNFYYDRKTFEYKFGAIQYFNADDLGFTIKNSRDWPSDYDFMKTALPKFIDKGKFASYMITVTAHTPYITSSKYGDKNLDLFKDTGYDMSVKRYLSKVKEADLALEYLLETLEEEGILDDTVIVLFGDHYPYALSDKNYQDIAGFDVSVNSEVDRTPFIIYNSATEPQKIEKYTSPMDYTPTLLNLFGIDYDPRYYMGNDVFSDYDDYVLFPDNSWQNAKGYYSSSKGEFIPNVETEALTDEEIIVINQEVTEKRDMSGLAIKRNYFSYLFKYFDEYEEMQKKKENEKEEEKSEEDSSKKEED